MRMFSWFRPPSAPDEIYASCLQTLHLGYALWYPEPHESGEPQIGDVGFVNEGAFIRLFNLDASAPEKKVTFWDPPYEITEPLPPGVLKIDRRHRPLVPDHYRSHGVEKTEMHASTDITAGANVAATLSASYTCKAAQGAVLILNSEAHAEKIFENRLLKKYIVRHHDRWYAYTRDDIFQDIEQKEIVVVSGWVKTTADWGAAAFSNTSTTFSASAEGHAGGVAGAGAGGSRSKSVTGPRMQRQGKSYCAKASEASQADTKRDQCVLLKRYKLRKRLGVLRKIVAGAGYHRLPGSGSGGGSSGEEGVMAQEEHILELGNEDEFADPLDVLLDYILETSDVEVAIASDDDVESIVGDRQVVDFASYLRQMQPPVEVDGTLGSVCIEDAISRERGRTFAGHIVTAPDLAKWPNALPDGAGRLVDWRVFVGPEEADTRPLKLKQLVFTDPQNPRAKCECYALSTDGKLLAASFSSSDIIVWRLPDGLLVQRLRAQSHRNNIRCLSFSSDGHALVSGSSDLDNNVIVWDVQRSHVLLQLEGHQSWWIDCVAYAPDNTLIATSDVSRSVKIWDASTGVCLKNLSLDKHPYWLTFSPDSLRLYLRTSDSCFIYDVRSYRRIAVLQHGENDAIQLSVSRQGDRVVSGGYSENGVKIWDAVTGQELLTINDERKPTPPVAFSPDGAEILAVCEADQTAQALAYDSQTGRLRNIFKLSHKPDCIAYSPNGDYVAFAARSGSLEVYDAKSRTFIGEVEGFGNGARMKEAEFLPDGLTILSHFEENSHESLRLCNVHDLVRMR